MDNFIRSYARYKPINRYNGLNKKTTFNLELEIYKRISGNDNFPKLISFEKEKCILIIENCGVSLDKFAKPFKIENLENQINNISKVLKENNIIHLDLILGNICYKNGKIFLIDFEIAVLDNKPLTPQINYRYNNSKRIGINYHKITLTRLLKDFF